MYYHLHNTYCLFCILYVEVLKFLGFIERIKHYTVEYKSIIHLNPPIY